MRAAAIVVAIVSILLTTASERVRKTGLSAPGEPVVTEWLSVLRKAYSLLSQPAQYDLALKRAVVLSQTYPQHRLAAKTAEFTAFALYSRFRFAEATRAYVRTKRLALAAGDPETAAFASNALSNIYLSSGNVDGALEAAHQAVTSVPRTSRPDVRATFELHYARLLSRSGRFAEAGPYFTRVAETAELEGLTRLRADAWKFAARELALRADLPAAERAAAESLRLRHLSGDAEMASDYHDLADIRLRAGRPAEALRYLDLARLRLGAAVRFPSWRVDLLRGRAWLELHDPRQALQELRRAVREIDSSPAYVLPGDMLRSQIARPTEAHELFSEAAIEELKRTHDRRLMHEAFAVFEAGRAAALRSASSRLATASPAAAERYWKAVTDLDEANAQLLRQPGEPARRRVSELRLALAELEAALDHTEEDSNRPCSPPPLQLLREHEALIAFQLGERLSLAWTLAGGRIEVARLPARQLLQRQMKAWMNAPPGPEKLSRARETYRMLFEKLPAAVHAASLWLLAVDGEMFQAPLSSLVTGFKASSRPTFLTEQHALQLIPGSWALERRQATPRTGRFLGVGDPIYNEADPRRPVRWSWPGGGDGGEAGLSRLAGAVSELQSCARFFPFSENLVGSSATPAGLSNALTQSPAVVHLALHVVPAPDSPRENLVALGIGPEGRPTFVGPEWIGAHRLPGSLVVMNGCRSGSGIVSAGEGLMGLTRAWLRAGASRVLSTYWPTLDDGGSLTAEFYRQLTKEGATPAEALRRAQIAMMAMPDWRADPQYWAAYFLIGYPE